MYEMSEPQRVTRKGKGKAAAEQIVLVNPPIDPSLLSTPSISHALAIANWSSQSLCWIWLTKLLPFYALGGQGHGFFFALIPSSSFYLYCGFKHDERDSQPVLPEVKKDTKS